MHEFSLVRSLLTQVEHLLRVNGGTAVTRVAVAIGPLSGVEPVQVREAFEQLSMESPPIRGAVLSMEHVALVGECRECRSECEIEGFRFECSRCGSTSIRVIRGDEFRLDSIEITAPTAAAQQE